MHQNVPGVMRDLNRLVSDRIPNIHAQVLSTNASIGYLIMDLDSDVAAQVVQDMRRLPTSISAHTVA